MKTLRLWFDGRSTREKRLVLVMMALLAVTIIWGGLLRPLGDGLSSARERHADAVIRLGEAEAIAADLRQRRRRPPALSGTLADTVRVSAEQAGFTLAALTEDGPGRVRAQIASARPAALTPWLARLERGGVLVEQATLTDNGDRTVAVALLVRTRAS
ncbi:type II secretion system protein GspM [Sphingomonadaceae bacterium jetA1]|jgi:general secretion pathway protein M|uniref:type II secretion system protein GspM n=1 Tax=Facivitalis istanbulensis TaxID=3075838 RepID=UPI00348101BA